MRKFVRGGSDEARLVPYKGEEMAERRILTDKEKQGMYTMHCLGESKEAIADRYEVAVSTVYRIIREQREEHEKMASSSQIVAGDKANGRLVTCADRTRFEGTCIINGKSKKRTFTAKNARDAQQQWSQRFEVSRGTIHGGSLDYDHMIVNTVTDTETGQKWLVVTTNHGAAITPMEEGE